MNDDLMQVRQPGAASLERAQESREVAEVQAAMVIAKRFPRDVVAATDRILRACTRPSLAEGALYSYSRGGQEISGPSIRMAEVMAQCWGNMDFGVRELSQRDGESVVQSYAWDLETNTRQTKTFTVSHIRYTRKGARPLEDPRDIYEQVANQAARRLRACILGVIPGDIQETAINQCEATLAAEADTSAEGIKKLVAAFDRFGVTKAQIEKRIQRRIDTIRPAQVVQLKKVYASLRDGMSGPEDWFGEPEADEAAQSAVERIMQAKKGRQAEKPPPEPQESPARTEVRERDAEPDHPQPMADALRRRLIKEVGGVGPKVIGSLEAAGAITVRQIFHLDMSGLKKLPGIGPQTAENLFRWCSDRIAEREAQEAAEKPQEPTHEASEDPPDIPFGEELGQQEEARETSEEGEPLSNVQAQEILKALHKAENRFGSLEEAEEFREHYLSWVKKALGADSIPMIPAEAYGLALQRIIINSPPPRKASSSVAG